MPTSETYIGIRKYQYLNFDQVPHLDPKSHGWPHILKGNVWVRRDLLFWVN